MKMPCAHDRQKGFTLIELLVVISIVGTLASVVLVSLNGARVKGKNGRIVEEATQLRNQIELSWNGTSYAAFAAPYAPDTPNYVAPNSFSNTSIQNLIADIIAQTPGSDYGGGTDFTSTYCGGTSYSTTYVAQNFGSDYPICFYFSYQTQLQFTHTRSSSGSGWL